MEPVLDEFDAKDLFDTIMDDADFLLAMLDVPEQDIKCETELTVRYHKTRKFLL